MIRPLGFAFCTVLLTSVVSVGQDGTTAAPSAMATRGRIRLDVVVNDKSGKPVSGLKRDDFTIVDGKRPQEIRTFEAVTEAMENREPVEFILVLDSANISFSREAFARNEIRHFLTKNDGKLPYPLSIGFLTDKGMSLQTAPTRDGLTIAALLDQNGAALRTIRSSQGIYGADERLQLSLRALQDISRYAAARPGRKIVIFVSAGWPILSGPGLRYDAKNQKAVFRSIVDLNTQLREAGITMCNADPSGQEGGVLHATVYNRFLKGVRSWEDAQIGDMSLQVLAVQSGGRVLNSNNDIATEIGTCVEDANAYYVLTFDAQAADGPDDYHPIEVKVAQPRMTVQTRTGYYAQPERR